MEPIIGLRCNPRVNGDAGNAERMMPEMRFRHYPFTLGFGFLVLHGRSMIDYFFLPIIGKIEVLKGTFAINVV